MPTQPQQVNPFRTRQQLVDEIHALKRELKTTTRRLESARNLRDMYKARSLARPRCYACDAFAVGVRDRRPSGGHLELACERHSEAMSPVMGRNRLEACIGYGIENAEVTESASLRTIDRALLIGYIADAIDALHRGAGAVTS